MFDLVGNACQHAYEFHAGSAIFIDLTRAKLIIYEGRRPLTLGELFVDEFGSTFDSNKFNYNLLSQYNLNKNLLSQCYKDLTEYHLTHRIVAFSRKMNLNPPRYRF